MSLIPSGNGYLAGLAMRQAVHQAMHAIRREQASFSVDEKEAYRGDGVDLVTSADGAGQVAALRVLRSAFPGIGIIAEEGEEAGGRPLRIEPDSSHEGLYFTLDPLDGTKAFVRRQGTGVGCMISLLSGDTVIGAYVGDVMNLDVFGFAPGASIVRRYSGVDPTISESLSIDPTRTLGAQYILLREIPADHDPLSQAIIQHCSGVYVGFGSIGVAAAQLWSGAVGALLLDASHETPWDAAPVVGISAALGFDLHAIRDDTLAPFPSTVRTETWHRDFPLLITHCSRARELEEVVRSARASGALRMEGKD